MTALDTSVLLPALLPWHDDHDLCRPAAAGAAVPAHAVFETYAVLTRLPAPHRIARADAVDALSAHLAPEARLVASADLQQSLVERLRIAGVSGGATYDALVALTAAEHGHRLLTRDRRAVGTYRAVGVPFELLNGA